MEIINIDLQEKSLEECASVVSKCKEILFENLEVNGGTLKQADIFEEGLRWTNLIIAVDGDKIVGFMLVRDSTNTHDLGGNTERYYYISEIAVSSKCKRQGVGTSLLENAVASKGELPLVASVLSDNAPSIGLLSKFMTRYSSSRTGKYQRFVDKESYKKIYGEKEETQDKDSDGYPSMGF